jgi:hypothetical protein
MFYLFSCMSLSDDFFEKWFVPTQNGHFPILIFQKKLFFLQYDNINIYSSLRTFWLVEHSFLVSCPIHDAMSLSLLWNHVWLWTLFPPFTCCRCCYLCSEIVYDCGHCFLLLLALDMCLIY